MDCLGKLIDKAHTDGIFSPFHPVPVKFRSSLYADDAVIFIKPTEFEMTAVVQILHIFGRATGLHTSLTNFGMLPCLFPLQIPWHAPL